MRKARICRFFSFIVLFTYSLETVLLVLLVLVLVLVVLVLVLGGRALMISKISENQFLISTILKI